MSWDKYVGQKTINDNEERSEERERQHETVSPIFHSRFEGRRAENNTHG